MEAGPIRKDRGVSGAGCRQPVGVADLGIRNPSTATLQLAMRRNPWNIDVPHPPSLT
jgi:hypothetical protein